MHADSSFEITSFENQPSYLEADGVAYSQTEIAKTFSGDFAGQGRVKMLSAGGEGGAGYVALEHISGTLQGRQGTFALLHVATRAGEETWGRWLIVPGSGTTRLTGIRGEGTISIDATGTHRLALEYELD